MKSPVRRLAATVLLPSVLVVATAQAAPATIRFELAAEPLDLALLKLGAATGRQVVFSPYAVRGRMSRPVSGELDVMEALSRLLPQDMAAEARGSLVIVRQVVPAAAVSEAAPSASPVAAEKEAPAVLTEVVVSALKYDTLLQRTPLSISLVSGLDDRGELSINDFYRRVPGLRVTTNGTSQQRMAIRGVRSVGEATTGLYFDETPVTGPAGSAADSGSTQPDLGLVDVERIEVLRGPQGTLYGAGSMGGTVRVIFNKPDAVEAGGRVELRGGLTESGAPSKSVRMVGNLPLVEDQLAARVAVYDEDVGGYVDNLRAGRRDANGERASGLRASVALTPTPALSMNGVVTWHRDDVDQALNFWAPQFGRYKTDALVIARYTGDLQLGSLTAQWASPFANLVATTSAYRWKTLNLTDYTATLTRSAAEPAACSRFFSIIDACDSPQAAVFAAYAGERTPGAWDQRSVLHSNIQELRASSPGGERLAWTIGLFREERSDYFDSVVYRADPVSGRIMVEVEPTGYRTVATHVKQTAGFGEVSVHPTPKFGLTLGARRYSYDKTVGGQVFIPNRITGSDLAPYSEMRARDDGWVTKVSAAAEPTRRVLLYATYSGGFRPGGANNVPGAGSAVPEAYEPDRLNSYEVGSKLGLAAGRLTINSAVYLLDWRDMQVSAASPNGAWRFNTNAGRAEITGGEIEAVAAPAPGWRLMLNGAYTEARIVEDQRNAYGVATGQAGDRIPFIPRWTAAFSMTRYGHLGDFRTTSRLDYSYGGSSGSQFESNASYTKNPASSLVDLQWAAERGGLEFSARLTNAFGAAGLQTVQASPALGGGGQVYGVRPSTLTLGLRRIF